MSSSTVLRFVQLLPEVSETGDYILKDLPGSGKRIDLLCRDLAACFDWGPSKWHLSQLELFAVLGENTILQFRNPGGKLPKAETEWAQIIQNSLQGHPPNFVLKTEGDVESLIHILNNPPESRLAVLHEEGKPMKDYKFEISGTQNSFMLGDHRGFNSKTEDLVSKNNLWKVSLGNTSYLSSHCVASIISEFERMV